jgi:hypothetical protein
LSPLQGSEISNPIRPGAMPQAGISLRRWRVKLQEIMEKDIFRMSQTHKDRNRWRLRKLKMEQEKLFQYPVTQLESSIIRNSPKYLQIQKKIDALQSEYAGNLDPKVGRKVTSRKSVARIKVKTRRREKRSERQKELIQKEEA